MAALSWRPEERATIHSLGELIIEWKVETWALHISTWHSLLKVNKRTAGNTKHSEYRRGDLRTFGCVWKNRPFIERTQKSIVCKTEDLGRLGEGEPGWIDRGVWNTEPTQVPGGKNPKVKRGLPFLKGWCKSLTASNRQHSITRRIFIASIVSLPPSSPTAAKEEVQLPMLPVLMNKIYTHTWANSKPSPWVLGLGWASVNNTCDLKVHNSKYILPEQ